MRLISEYNIVAIIVSSILALSCQGEFSNSSKNSNDRSNNDSTSHSQEDSSRPTEESEGIPGYLVEPEKISISINNTSIKITSEVEAIKPAGGEPSLSEFEVPVWEIEREVLLSVRERSAQTEIKSRLLGHVKISQNGEVNGSFSDIAVHSDNAIVISFGSESKADGFIFEESKSRLPIISWVDSQDGFKFLAEFFKRLSELFSKSVSLNDSLWYVGEAGKSCVDVCQTRGGVNEEATINFSGTGGSAEQCQAISSEFGAILTRHVRVLPSLAVGCSYDPIRRLGVYYSGEETTVTASKPWINRICACQE